LPRFSFSQTGVRAAARRGWLPFLVVALMLADGGWHLGIDSDEQIQFTALLGQPVLEGARPPWNLYDFGRVRDDSDAEIEHAYQQVALGQVKWCQAPLPFKVYFFRPLSSGVYWLEFQLFGLHLRLYHLFELALFFATCAGVVVLWNRALEDHGIAPLPVAAAAALLTANPINQEILARICTIHYLVAAIFGFGAYLILLNRRLPASARVPLALLLGAASLFASEASLPVHAIAGCAMALHFRKMRRGQKLAWGALLLQVGVYFAWYVNSSFNAQGYGYLGIGTKTPMGFSRTGQAISAAIDVFTGAFLLNVSRWQGVLISGAKLSSPPVLVAGPLFVVAVTVYLIRNPRRRLPAAALLAATAASALPVAAVAQPYMRILALPSLPMQILLCLMARDGWEALRARFGGRGRVEEAADGPSHFSAAGAVIVLAYALVRLASNVALAPTAVREVAVRSRVVAAQWLRDFNMNDAHADRARDNGLVTPPGDANVLIVSATTGAPSPFGAALLARNGFTPDVERWLFLSDLHPGRVQFERTGQSTYRVSLTAAAARFNLTHHMFFSLAQRCSCQKWHIIQTRLAAFLIRDASIDGDPLDVDLQFRPGVEPKFWTLKEGRIVPTEPPAVGQTAVY
jgi:hypothetical protein